MASLYLHIPFCDHKCIYCDFYSIAPAGSGEEQRQLVESFLTALEKEIRLRAEEKRFQESYETIFFGGGTPSLLEPGQVEQILSSLHAKFSIQPGAEITLETNPGTVSLEKLHAFRSAGINRLSIGIQSFHETDLRFLTRIHDSSGARQCVEQAHAAGFENINIDLIFSLPGQTLELWQSNLQQALALQPAHISCYSLIVEPNTPLFRMVRAKQVTPLDSDRDAELYEFTIDFLRSRGYEQYEVSNFAKNGSLCRHNLNYWNHSNYLGLGPSAHSYWNDERWWNIAHIGTYTDHMGKGAFPLAGSEHLTDAQLLEERIFLGLRSNGIDLSRYRARFGKDFVDDHRSLVENLLSDGRAELTRDRFRLTPAGYLVCDEICQLFL